MKRLLFIVETVFILLVACAPQITASCGTTNNAKYIAQSVPSTMQAGTSVQVSITFQNTGTSCWSSSLSYRLGAQNPRDNATWGRTRVDLNSTDNIQPGQQKTFTFSVTAPNTPGAYNLEWQMLREGVAWFGNTSSNVVVNVTTNGTGQYVILNIGSPENDPNFASEIVAALGHGSPLRRLGFGYPIELWKLTNQELVNKLDQVFSLSEQYDLPVLLHVDAERWWDNRPDLWNWFDPSQPGYNAANSNNVEWSDWNTPTKDSWLNWGTPTQVQPRPCFESTMLRNEIQSKDATIATKVKSWLAHLQSIGKPYLFAGIDTGWETGIDNFQGVNWVPTSDQVHLGYCALTKRGFSASNPPANREAELANAVRDFSTFEAKQFSNNGIPVNKVFTHIWGAEQFQTATTYHMHAPLIDAFTCPGQYALPGWSLYGYSWPSLSALLPSGTQWAVTEAPIENLTSLISKAGITLISVYNWDSAIKNNSTNTNTVRSVIGP